MSIVLLTKRGVAFQRLKRAEQVVVYIPSAENIKIYKDVADSHTIAERYGANNQKPLWRQERGQTVVYGLLPATLAQRRQALKVHLAQDFAPKDANAFYFLFDPKWLVHGRRETDDEGREEWRVTLIKIREEEEGGPTRYLKNAIAELMMDNVESRICVAVADNFDLYEDLKTELQPLSIKPVPFSSLKVSSSLRPLYRQRDFTPLMLLSLLVAGAVLAGAVFYWFMYWTQTAKIDQEISQVRGQIMNIQINKSLGNITDPHAILTNMEKAFNQQPSAILAAAANFGKEFGELESIEFDTEQTDRLRKSNDIRTIEAGEHVASIFISKVTNQLLVDQERLAGLLAADRPWVRRVENIPQGNAELSLDVVFKTEESKQ